MYKRYLRHGFRLLVWACYFQACHPVPQKGTRKDGGLVQSLAFEYLRIGATVGYQDQESYYDSVYVRFRVKKDHVIWFSVLTPWGIEIFRGIITPTRITFLNDRRKAYYVYDYVTLRSFWPGPWNYASLQALLLGELSHDTAPQKIIQKTAQQIVMQQKKEAWLLTYFLNPTLRKVEKLIATANHGRLVALYNLFKPCQGGLLFRRATLTWYYRTAPTQPAMILTLKGMQPQWPKKPLLFPFSIPAHYEKKQALQNW